MTVTIMAMSAASVQPICEDEKSEIMDRAYSMRGVAWAHITYLKGGRGGRGEGEREGGG